MERNKTPIAQFNRIAQNMGLRYRDLQKRETLANIREDKTWERMRRMQPVHIKSTGVDLCPDCGAEVEWKKNCGACGKVLIWKGVKV